MRRLLQVSLAAVLGIAGLPVLMSDGNVAQAVETAMCKPTANVFVGIANSNDFRLRKNSEPAAGYNVWTADNGIGWGWNIRFMAGPDGYVWFIEDNALRRHRWNDEAQTWHNGGVSEVVQTGWGGWDQPKFHFRVTVDTNNFVYSVDMSGDLAVHKYDPVTKTMTRTVLATGWDKYDHVFAAGNGVIYARDPNVNGGTLYRNVYNHTTNTWTQQDKFVGVGWNMYKQITSPGADILYGMHAGGETWWYRYLPEQDKWQKGAYGNDRERISTWTDADEIAPAIDSCKLGDVAPEVECKPTVDLFGSFADNNLWRREHMEPETGITNWNAPQNIGFAWNDNQRFLAGANGWKYTIRHSGEVHRTRWNGTGWDNNGVSEKIAEGWGGWADPNYHNRITVDSNNHFYAVLATGQLEHLVYDEVAKTWTKTIIDDGWGKYDQVFAAGDGVLFARDRNVNDGALFRFHYDWKNRRWIQYAEQLPGAGWNMHKQILSPGADVIYALSGWDLYWYRWNNATKSWANSAEDSGREHIYWWQNVNEFMVDVDQCKLKAPEVVTPPTGVPAPQNERPQMIYNPTRTQFEVSYVDDAGTLFWGHQTVPGTESMTFQGLSSTGFTGRASLAQRDDKKTVVMGYGSNAQAKAYTQKTAGNTQWDPPAGVNGALFSAPVLVRGNDKLLTAFAVDGNNKLWYATQFTADGAFRSWRQATNNGTYNMTGDMTVVAAGNGFEIAYRNPQGAIAVKRFANGALQAARTAPGVTGAGTPGAVVFSDGKVQLAVRGTDNKVYTQREGSSGFAGWTDISGALEFTGSPAVLLNNFGIVEIVIRDTFNDIHRTGQTSPGRNTWRVWENLQHTSPVDPAFAAGSGTEQRIFYRIGAQYYLIQTQSYSSDQQAALPANADLEASSTEVTPEVVTGSVK
ncbi:hypothetical protein BBK82_31335 [Lentzea guizhouensis]|uniref:Tachylectin 2 domain-containing protein n=1 Tax=Lentzea guizhouensis TaxID=1586287 RepID=A0A1B2HQ84_9PSEU|nr:hypothetical protein BBK82_31335 [Lentzea guizhouensis]